MRDQSTHQMMATCMSMKAEKGDPACRPSGKKARLRSLSIRMAYLLQTRGDYLQSSLKISRQLQAMAEVPQSLCLIMRHHLHLECWMNLKIPVSLRDFLPWDLILRHLSPIERQWDVRTFRAHYDIGRRRMIPEERNRAIFEILHRAHREIVRCILLHDFGGKVSRSWTDGLLRSVIMKQA